MSKYIRTEDRIIDTEKEFSSLVTCGTKQEFANLLKKNFNCVYVSDDDKNIHANCGGEQIKIPYVKQADAIEELCDCCLEDYGRGVPATISKRMLEPSEPWLDFLKGKVLRKEITLYACIIKRDGKGTHIEPVAKMNEKGEFKVL